GGQAGGRRGGRRRGRVAGVGRLAGLEVTGRPGADPAAARREAGGRQVGAGLAPRGVPRLDQDPRPSHARTEPTTTPRTPAPTPPQRAEVTAAARMPREHPACACRSDRNGTNAPRPPRCTTPTGRHREARPRGHGGSPTEASGPRLGAGGPDAVPCPDARPDPTKPCRSVHDGTRRPSRVSRSEGASAAESATSHRQPPTRQRPPTHVTPTATPH